MPLLEAPPVVPEVQSNDLAHLQLEIARCADELAKSVVSGRPSDLALWLQAEQEVFARSLADQAADKRAQHSRV